MTGIRKMKAKVSDGVSGSKIKPSKLACVNDPNGTVISAVEQAGVTPNTENFFYPDIKNLSLKEFTELARPDKIRGMEKASRRLAQAIINKEKIHGFGDFDPDGMTSLTIMILALEGAGCDVSRSIASRASHGHGPEEAEAIKAIGRGVTFSFTTDCGCNEIHIGRLLRGGGVDYVPTDHHEVEDEVSDLVETDSPYYSLLNPSDKRDGWGNRKLCGAGVALMFLISTWDELEKVGHRPKFDLIKLFPLAAFGTIADVMEMGVDAEINRYIIAMGLEQLKRDIDNNDSLTPMLSEITKKSVLGYKGDTSLINAQTVAFSLGPILNSKGGRQDKAMEVVESLMETNPENYKAAAEEIISINDVRKKQIQPKLSRMVEDELKRQSEYGDDRTFVIIKEPTLYGSDKGRTISFPTAGLAGVVAGDFARKNKTLAGIGTIRRENNENIITFSLRDGAGVSVIDALDYVSASGKIPEFSYGGHAGAGGCQIKEDYINTFLDLISSNIDEQIESKDLTETITYVSSFNKLGDAESHYFTSEMVDNINLLEPFGNGNPRPLIKLTSMRIKNFARRGAFRSFTFEDRSGYIMPCTYFGEDDISREIDRLCTSNSETPHEGNPELSCIVTLNKDRFRGTPTFNLVDIEAHD